jgi:hypothetical protein
MCFLFFIFYYGLVVVNLVDHRLSNHLDTLETVSLAGTRYNDMILTKWLTCANDMMKQHKTTTTTWDGIDYLDMGQTAITKQSLSSSLFSSSLLFSNMTTLRLDGIAMKDMNGDFLLPFTRLQKLVRSLFLLLLL